MLLAWGSSSVGRAPRSQCGGQEFDPPLLHHLFSTNYSRRQRWLFWRSGQYLDIFSGIQLHGVNSRTFALLNCPKLVFDVDSFVFQPQSVPFPQLPESGRDPPETLWATSRLTCPRFTCK